MALGIVGNLLTPDCVKSLVPLYPGERPFGGSHQSDQNEATSDGSSRVWVTPLVDKDWPAEALAKDRSASQVAEATVDASTHRLFKAHWDCKPPFAVGDWIVTRQGAQRQQLKIGPPTRVIESSLSPERRLSGLWGTAEQHADPEYGSGGAVAGRCGERDAVSRSRRSTDRQEARCLRCAPHVVCLSRLRAAYAAAGCSDAVTPHASHVVTD